ncbi:hypothetical protein AVEN_254086-1, partial [Araneus ventricosus]
MKGKGKSTGGGIVEWSAYVSTGTVVSNSQSKSFEAAGKWAMEKNLGTLYAGIYLNRDHLTRVTTSKLLEPNSKLRQDRRNYELHIIILSLLES